jgi:hypothetical protein
LCGNKIGQRIENPGTVAALPIGIHIVGDAVLNDHAAREFHGVPSCASVVFENAFYQGVPMAADAAIRIQKLVIAMRVAAIMLQSRILIDDCAGPA